MEAALRFLLGAAVEHALESTDPVHAHGAADGPSLCLGTHQSPSLPSSCVDEARALRSRRVVLSRRSSLLRPAPTASRPPGHFPGSPVIGGHRFPPPAAAGPRRLSPVPRTTFRPFNAHYAGGSIGARSRFQGAFRGLRRSRIGSAPSLSLDDACSGFARAADQTVASASHRTQPLGRARGPRYRGPGRLPGPDSHRLAALSLSLGYVMSNSFLSWHPSIWAHSGKGWRPARPGRCWHGAQLHRL
jgi:hypothetical protein